MSPSLLRCAPTDSPVFLYQNVLLPPAIHAADDDGAGAGSGAGARAPLVILHGLLGAARNFQSLARLYQQQETPPRAVVCIDLRNHGRTAAGLGAQPMDYTTMAADVRHTLMRLGVRRAHVLGHSMGGKVAAALALSRVNDSNSSNDAVEVLSLTMMDISPVDYSSEPAFQSVFSTLDTVRALAPQVPLAHHTCSLTHPTLRIL